MKGRIGVYLKRRGVRKYSREREQHFHKCRVMRRFDILGDSRNIWHCKNIGCVADEARDVTRERQGQLENILEHQAEDLDL